MTEEMPAVPPLDDLLTRSAELRRAMRDLREGEVRTFEMRLGGDLRETTDATIRRYEAWLGDLERLMEYAVRG